MRLYMVALVALLTLGATDNAYAYIDPGAGSMLLQMLVAGVAGALFTIRIYWQRVKAFFQVYLKKTPSKD